jgi:hypothetical protein
LSATGVPSQESSGSQQTLGSNTLRAIGISSNEKSGAHNTTPVITAVGVPSAEAFGLITPTFNLTAVGVRSDEKTGAHNVIGTSQLTATGIATGEKSGSHNLSVGAVSLTPVGVRSAEASGQHGLYLERMHAVGVVSAERSGGTSHLGNQPHIDATSVVGDQIRFVMPEPVVVSQASSNVRAIVGGEVVEYIESSPIIGPTP